MKKTAVIMILTAIVALAAINFLVSRHPIRADLTDSGAFTLSDSTKKLIKGLNDVLTIRVYFSENVPPALLGVRRDVDDLLSELKQSAGGKIQIEHINPSASAMDEQRAQLMGIFPVQLNVYGGDKVEVAKVYLGIALLYGGKQEVIPVVYSAANLEYELVGSIVKVSSDKVTRIGWWEGKNAEDETSPYSLVKQAVSKRYETTELGPAYRQAGKGEVIDMDPKTLSAILLMSPRNLTDEELFAIDQYLMKGGRVMALIDRADINAKLEPAPIESNLTEMLAHYGATIEDDFIIDESSAMAAFSGGPVTYHIPYALWPEVPAAGYNNTSPITVNIQSTVFPWTASISLSGEESNAWIAKSSGKASAIPTKGATMDPKTATEALVKATPAVETIAAMNQGPFASYFSGTGKTPPRGASVIAEGNKDATVFIVGSSRWIMDKFLMNFPQNASLFENALDFLSMSDSLVGIRSREDIRRPIAVLPDDAKSLLRYVNIAAGPFIVGAVGAVAMFKRRRRRKKTEAKFQKAA